jgi:serine/threonine protein phosphatase 1
VAADPASFFAVLAPGRRLWAVGAIHGEAARLAAVHDVLRERFASGDRLVYLGNYLGYGPDVLGAQNEMLRFRREILARPGVFACDVAFLRGAQEEMWRKLLQLQFATGPGEVLDWMLGQGLGPTLQAYRQDARDAKVACREGALAIAKWTVQVRNAMHSHAGHEEMFASLRRAAHTAGRELLFVAAGIDPNRPLLQQGDVFWWGSGYFSQLKGPFEGFRRVVRGYSRSRDGVDVESYGATIDGGCGLGGTLNAVCFDYDGKAVDWIEA